MKKLIFILAMALSLYTIKAQTLSSQLLSSAGESFKNTSYQLDWSIGELQTETYTASPNILSQGFHQGMNIVSAIAQHPALQFNITAYPNPVTDFVNVKIDKKTVGEMQFAITDFTGKVLRSGKITDRISKMDFSAYAVGTYFLTIRQNNQFLKSFKIIKH